MNCANGYAEPGYTDPDRCVLFADWNNFPRGFDRVLERAGYAVEWSDEWAVCEDCQRAFRTSADSYSWRMSGVITEHGACICHGCLDPADHLASLEDDPSVANVVPTIDPADHGYVLLEDHLESGFHPGQTDDPRKVFAGLQAKGYQRIVFNVNRVRQFDMQFSVFYRPDDEQGED
jgi:hypothetical protein